MVYLKREIGISIILCSYNGEKKLLPTLRAIYQQNVPQTIHWEVLFVDNNSSDNTLKIVHEHQSLFSQSAIPLHILKENRAGKFHALKKGISEAKYSYFIIVDDDNWLAEDYVEKAFQHIHANPNIGAIGSYSEAVFENVPQEIPKWFTKNKERYAVGEQGKDGNVTSRKHIWGAGMVSRTDLYEQLFAQHPSLLFDNDIEDIYVAEDTEFCLRLILKKYELHYYSDLKIKHFVPDDRLSYEYCRNLNQKIENSFKIIDLYHGVSKLLSKKYQNPFEKKRLKIMTLLRYFCTLNKAKKQRNKVLMGFLYPSSKFRNKCIARLDAFLKDNSLVNPNVEDHY
ncbi:glycosyltransferase [Sphingobacterium litopenaei]|uniref:Glycosyltransferase family 2 protein n=1 Tax=Sphingobacterium litopenaei TaxID=2763500 RepID=A0ABR7YI09_9SPHI|nr:glycosyltransferase [Sphingobacterium litopenaei]MBD1430962.1 glycosyltransferase family 2 protein [Sphingobacterium litopenaei]